MKSRSEIHTAHTGHQLHPMVNVSGGTLTYVGALNDSMVTDYITSLPDALRQDTCDRALGIGLRVLIAQRTEASVIALADQLRAASENVAQYLGAAGEHIVKQIELLENGYLAEDGRLPKSLGKITADFQKAFSADGETVRDLREKMTKDLMQPARAVLKEIGELMNLADECSPLGALDKKVTGLACTLASLTAKLDAQTALTDAKRRNPVATGASLEQHVVEVVEPLAKACGDIFEDVRDHGGTTDRGKTGDFLTHINSSCTLGDDARFVTEAKNRSSVSLKKLLSELDQAMQNRGASAALGVLTNPKASSFPSVDLYGNKVVVCLPGFGSSSYDVESASIFIGAGYQLARGVAIVCAKTPTCDGVDMQALRQRCDEMNVVGKRFSTLAGDLTRIHSATKNAESTLSDLRSSFTAALESIQAEIAVSIDTADCEDRT